MKRRTALPIAAAVLVLAACGNDQDGEITEPPVVPVSVTADLVDAEGSRLGSAVVTDESAGVRIELDASGMTPGDHPVGLHEVGVCEPTGAGADEYASTGDPIAGGGELTPLVVGEDGLGRLSSLLSGVDLGALLDEDGTALVVRPVPGVAVPPDEAPASLAACAEISR